MTTTKMTAAILGLALLPMLAVPAVAERGDRDHGHAFMTEADTDGNGELSAAEIEAHKTARFAAADTDGNGSLSAEEMQASRDNQRNERRARGMERMMKRLDTDGDGELSLVEMSKENRHAAMFARLDANDDGVLSAEEFAELEQGRRGGRDGRHGGRN